MASQSKENKFYSEKQLQEIADDIDRAVTIPVNTQIEAEHRVLDFSEMKEILINARRIALQNCGCKTEHKNCDAPRDVCINLDYEADLVLKSGTYNAREIGLNEALMVLERSHEAGLVHMAYIMKGDEKPGLICSCCSCCCHTLGGLLRYGIHTQVLSSTYIAEDNREKCTDCGKCVDRCAFKARIMKEGELDYDQSKCYGCGLCVSTCPNQAITMTERAQIKELMRS